MVQDSGWKSYFSDDARYADVINGLGCNGRQPDVPDCDLYPVFRREAVGRTDFIA